MKVEQILMLDCRKEGNIELLKKAICKIPPLEKYGELEEIPLTKIEKYIDLMCRRYCIDTQYMMIGRLPQEITWYSISFRTALPEAKWIGEIHGCTLHEAWSKAAIFVFWKVKKLNIQRRPESEES